MDYGILLTASDWPTAAPLSPRIVAACKATERLARFSMGIALAIALSNTDFVHRPGGETGFSLSTHVWIMLAVTTRLACEMSLLREFGQMLPAASTRFGPFLLHLLPVLLPSLLLSVYWGVDVYKPDTERTPLRSFVGTMACMGQMELLSHLRRFKAYLSSTHNVQLALLLARGVAISLLPLLLLWYDQMPRRSVHETPHAWILGLAVAVGSPLALAEFAICAGRLYYSLDRIDLTRTVCRVATRVLMTVFVCWALWTYSAQYANVRDTCGSDGAPAHYRFAPYGANRTEQVDTCVSKCDTGVQGPVPCSPEYEDGCCASVTAVFALGEYFPVQQAFLLCVVLYCTVIGGVEFCVEAVAVITLSATTDASSIVSSASTRYSYLGSKHEPDDYTL